MTKFSKEYQYNKFKETLTTIAIGFPALNQLKEIESEEKYREVLEFSYESIQSMAANALLAEVKK